MRIEIRNAGPEAAELHVLPTLWFRNRWSWGDDMQRPSITVAASGRGEAMAIAEDADIGRWRLVAGPDPTGRPPELLFCENETNVARLYGVAARTPYPKDGVNDHVVAGAATVNPAQDRHKDGLLASPLGRRRARASNFGFALRATMRPTPPTWAPTST